MSTEVVLFGTAGGPQAHAERAAPAQAVVIEGPTSRRSRNMPCEASNDDLYARLKQSQCLGHQPGRVKSMHLLDEKEIRPGLESYARPTKDTN